MRVLVDTHAFLWFLDDNPHLTQNARMLIEDKDNDVYLSVGSLWEMAIKVSLGKLTLGQPFGTFIPAQLALNDITLLNITADHASTIATLPFHHRDPFDRLLAAQAFYENMPLISADSIFDAYGVIRRW